MRLLIGLWRREWRLARTQPTDLLLPLAFYLLVAALFAFGGRPNDPALAGFAPAVLWVGALLASLMSLDRLFHPEFDDGTLEQWCLADTPLPLIVMAKLLAHWVIHGLPLALMAVPIAGALGVPAAAWSVLCGGLALGTLVLVMVGGLASSLAVGLPRAGALMPLLVLPLLDLGRLCVLRVRQGRRPWDGDRLHLAHELERRGLGVLAVLGVLLGVLVLGRLAGWGWVLGLFLGLVGWVRSRAPDPET